VLDESWESCEETEMTEDARWRRREGGGMGGASNLIMTEAAHSSQAYSPDVVEGVGVIWSFVAEDLREGFMEDLRRGFVAVFRIVSDG